ncbi:MAG: hypothetical protein U5O39_02485 [Gammaproteobacteria bacterium]|nr:hypothetical protein [Gammaproteobacteria bacterium]
MAANGTLDRRHSKAATGELGREVRFEEAVKELVRHADSVVLDFQYHGFPGHDVVLEATAGEVIGIEIGGVSRNLDQSLGFNAFNSFYCVGAEIHDHLFDLGG